MISDCVGQWSWLWQWFLTALDSG